MSDWEVRGGAIIEQPRDISEYPLLNAIYRRHDALISHYAVGGEEEHSLEIAFGTHQHPDADIGIDAFHDNTLLIEGLNAVTADARALPFRDESFDTVIGRRFLHHVPDVDRGRIVEEAARVLVPDGRLILLEGTPGTYRRIIKEIGFRLSLLGEDSDEYGHLTPHELKTLVDKHGFDLREIHSLGSPLIPLSIVTSPWVARLTDIYDRTQWVTWWTLLIAEPRT